MHLRMYVCMCAFVHVCVCVHACVCMGKCLCAHEGARGVYVCTLFLCRA